MKLTEERAILISCAYPVVQARIRNNTVQIKRTCLLQARPNTNNRRSKITKLTHKSLSRLALTVTETETPLLSILTLSYGATFPSNGSQSKRHLNSFLSWLRSRGYTDYVWFLEFQDRGAPHYHLLCGWEYDKSLHRDIAHRWASILRKSLDLTEDEFKAIRRQHNRKAVYEKIRKRDGAARYAIKYACKLEQKIVPVLFSNVGRFWGASRSVKEAINPGHLIDVTETELRHWLADRCQESADWLHLPEVIYLRKRHK